MVMTDAASPGRREEAASAFETMLLSELLRPVLAESSGSAAPLGFDGPFGSLLVEEYARLLAGRGGLGLQDPVARALADPLGPGGDRSGETARA
ncbi:hypothetical protein SH611_17615 [Geminicoccaceae bacterium 1502E]|nr:hypothetical protein [Geminicoccaceae bacterium 1502E]